MNFSINDLKNSLNEINNISIMANAKKLKLGPFESYDVKKQWFSNYIPGGANNGIYIYTNRDTRVLYIGKAEYENNRGINFRACGHLGSVSKDSENIFNNHQWTDDPDLRITEEIKNILKKGDFLIWTFPIEPKYLVSFFEVYFQTVCKHISGELPPLNKRIG